MLFILSTEDYIIDIYNIYNIYINVIHIYMYKTLILRSFAIKTTLKSVCDYIPWLIRAGLGLTKQSAGFKITRVDLSIVKTYKTYTKKMSVIRYKKKYTSSTCQNPTHCKLPIYIFCIYLQPYLVNIMFNILTMNAIKTIKKRYNLNL